MRHTTEPQICHTYLEVTPGRLFHSYLVRTEEHMLGTTTSLEGKNSLNRIQYAQKMHNFVWNRQTLLFRSCRLSGLRCCSILCCWQRRALGPTYIRHRL